MHQLKSKQNHKITVKPNGKNFENASLDSDSLTLILSPWHRLKKPPDLTGAQTGRTVHTSGFCLCFTSILLLSLGVGLSCISIWSIIFKNPYAHLVECSIELAYFAFPAAFLCFPCFWIAAAVHNDEKSHRFLPLMMTLLTFSIILTAAGVYFGFTHQLRNALSPKINEILEKDANATMRHSMALYKIQDNFKNAWDQVQTKLRCCGVENYSDWLEEIGEMPKSCDVNRTGCLRPTIYTLAWQTTFFSGLNSVALTLQVAILLAVTIVYIVDNKWRNC